MKTTSRSFQGLLIFIIGFIAYFLLARLGLHFATINQAASPVWPATAFAVAYYLRFGKLAGGAIFIGAVIANASTGLSLSACLLIGSGNFLEAFIAVFIIQRVFKKPISLEADPAYFHSDLMQIIFSLFAGSLASALIGSSSLVALKTITASDWLNSLTTWWTGDFLGGLLFFPFFYKLITVLQTIKLTEIGKIYFRSILGASLVSVFGYVVFFTHFGQSFIYILFPALILAFLIGGETAIRLSVVVISLIAVFGTAQLGGPFVWGETNGNLMALQIFLFSLGVTALALVSFSKYLRNPNVLVILGIGWILSGTIFFAFDKNGAEMDRNNLLTLSDLNIQKIKNRLTAYEDIFLSTAGFFASSDYVSKEEFASFVRHIKITLRYPGIRGIGFIENVELKKLNQFQNEIKKMNPQNSIHEVPANGDNLRSQAHPGEPIHIIKYIEPQESNSQVIGLVTSSEEKRRLAALKSAELKTPQLTGDITLFQDKKNRIGFLMFLPVFKSNELLGWIYAPFIFEDFISGLLPDLSSEINFSITSLDEPSQKRILFDSLKTSKSKSNYIQNFQLYNRNFQMNSSPSSGFGSSRSFAISWIGNLGSLLALISAWMYINMLIYREGAERKISAQTQELVQSTKMASLGEMAGGIAHEINSPLAIIQGKAQLLRSRIQEGNFDGAYADNELKKIENTVDRIARIIKGLRLFSRDSSTDAMTSYPIEKIIDETLSLCQERFKNFNVQIQLNIRTTGNVICRPSQIAQVLLNLLNNSFDAVQSCSEKSIFITVERKEGSLVISVVDTGIGIPDEVAPKIMQPFFTTKEVNQGTGLGLSISKGLIESHNGTLEYLKDPQGRTCFQISLPVTESVS